MNLRDFIETILDNQQLTFLVDTQADVSIIKHNAILNKYLINRNETIWLKGITDESIESMGTVYCDLNFGSIKVRTKFNVVKDDFPIPSNALLGKDFIYENFCRIDYGDMTFTVRNGDTEIILPIKTGPKGNTVVVPARSEVFRIFKISNFTGPSLIEKREISPGIFTASTVAHTEETLVRILNTTENTTILENEVNDAINLDEFRIFSIKSNSNNKRMEKLSKILKKRVSHQHEKALLKLCTEYSDIFALDDDKLTVNNFYTQKIRMTDDHPTFIKNYRIPMTQKEEVNRQVQKLIANNLIEPSHSAYNSPILLVPKKSKDGDKKWRMVIDYKQLNKKLIPDKHPLPRIDDILDSLGKAKFFTILDLYSGFHQIKLDENSRECTAFSTDKGIYQWCVLPFGLNISPNAFCRMMQIAFSGLGPDKCFIYMDDIIVIGRTEQEHLENLRQVFEVCRARQLKLNPEKADFFRPEVTFLGHRCTKNGLLPDESKIECIKKYPKPTNADETKRFTAFTNYYRRFIKNYAVIARPLNLLTRKNTEFKWTKECDASFNHLINAIISPPILQYPDYTSEFIITVDACHTGCGAVLSQMKGTDDLPIHYISRSFINGELHKDIVEKEMLAIHFAVKTFQPYVFGRHFTVRSDHRPLISLYKLKNPTGKVARLKLDLEDCDFTIEHIPGRDNVAADALSRITINDLKTLYKNNVTMLRLTRTDRPTCLHINDFKEIFEDNNKILAVTRSMSRKNIQNTKNVENTHEIKERFVPVIEKMRSEKKSVPRMITNAQLKLCARKNKNKIFEIDLNKFIANEQLKLGSVLSLLEKVASECSINEIAWPKNDKLFQMISISDFKEMCMKNLKKLQISLTDPAQKILNEQEKRKIMSKYHDDPLCGGHCGQKKLLAKIKDKFTWKKMAKDVADYVRNCKKCLLNKVKSATREEMTITKTPQGTFDTILVDTIGPLPRTDNDNEYIVTLICDLSKFLVAIPTKSKDANTVARAIFEHFILIFGPMKELISDQGTEYKNQILMKLCELMGVNQKFSTPHHHESVGSIERNHRSFNEYLRAYAENILQWDSYLSYFVYCYNTSKNSTFENKYSPYELVFSKKCNNFENINLNVIEPLYNIENYALECRYRLQMAHMEASKLIEKMKATNKKYYDRNLNILDVKRGDKVLLKKEPQNKHSNIYDGPFDVELVDNCNVTILYKGKNLTVHKNRLIKVK